MVAVKAVLAFFSCFDQRLWICELNGELWHIDAVHGDREFEWAWVLLLDREHVGAILAVGWRVDFLRPMRSLVAADCLDGCAAVIARVAPLVVSLEADLDRARADATDVREFGWEEHAIGHVRWAWQHLVSERRAEELQHALLAAQAEMREMQQGTDEATRCARVVEPCGSGSL